ncbi:MAG: T9SS type A sorting domain-containing protein [Flavobacteriaceae bacterium]|nr:T9SS type A sorting domain-containing protein [Flavobacteriaceae bacterium]
MKQKLLSLLFFLPFLLASQVTTSPAVPTANDQITVTLTTTGTGLDGYTGDVYAHTGVTVDGTRWSNVIGNWAQNSVNPKLTKINNTTYELVITPDVFTYYGVATNKTITELNFVFRSSDASKQTSPDIFIQIFEEGLNVVLTNPSKNNEVYDLNDNITLSAESSISADLELFVNNISQKTAFGVTTISSSYTFTSAGSYTIKVDADKGAETASDEKIVYVKTTTQNATIPSGVIDGFNNNGNGTVTFVLTAPNKTDVFVLGEFNDFGLTENYQMKKDGDKFWVTISGLDANTEYAYQYLIDYEIKIADPYAIKILDPNNDKYIPSETYPNLKAYPTDLTTGNVSTFKMNETSFNWIANSFTPPDQENLIVYELLLRDFEVVNSNDIGDLKRAMTHLDYLQDLGINAIELMPVNEFEGNDSWGYNPSFHGALDKAYGTKNDLKKFVDECHKRDIAVIIDVVYNHAFSQSPLAQMFWDSANSRPSSNNPWLNPIAKHDFNVGYDFNHESEHTKNYVKQTLKYWLEEYRIDGFRFDLSKGFTQKNTLGNVSAWGQYDATRIAILKDYADHVWSVNSNAYTILEHFADNNEEKELSAYGMLLWGNTNHNYNQNTMGYSSESDISWISYQKRGWSEPHVMGYMESHDEERLMFKNLQHGNSNGSYNVKNLNTALSRQELAGNFFFTIPGPKMIWQFGELGYGISIDEGGRLGRKPIHWEYFDDANRRKIYDVWATLAAFKKEQPAFQTTDYTLNVNTLVKGIVLRHSSMDVVVIGNFDVTTKSINPQFTKTGTWYEYYTGSEMNVTSTSAPISLQPGEYRLYSTVLLQDPLPVDKIVEIENGLFIYPNPAKGSFRINKSVSQIEIYDMLGRMVKAFKGDFNSYKSFDVSTLKTSMYVVKLRSDAGVSTRRLIIE